MLEVDPVLAWTVAVGLVLVFAGSAAMKFADLDAFEAAVESYQVLPEWMVWPFACLVPLAESAAAVGMVLPATHLWAAATMLILLGAFSLAILINLARGRRDIDCGCFGAALRQRLSGWLLARNGALILSAAAVLLPGGRRTLASLDMLTIAFATATLFILYLAINYLLANAPALRALEMSDA